MRNDRRIGGPVRDSTGDRELDDVGEAVVVRAVMAHSDGGFETLAACPSDAALDEQFRVRRAGFVLREAVLEGVAEVVDAEVPGAAGVGTIQERAVVAGVRHSSVTKPRGVRRWRSWRNIGPAADGA